MRTKRISIFFILIILSWIPDISTNASVWTHIAFDQPVKKIQIHPEAPSYIYVTVEGQGILKTIDGGNSWQKLGFNPDKLLPPTAIALHPVDTQILYGTAVLRSVWGLLPIKSNDGGESWEGIWRGLELDDLWDRAHFRAIAVDPNEAAIIYLGDSSGPPVCGTYFSRDGGSSWKFVVDNWQGNGASSFAISPLDSTVYAIIRTTQPGGYIHRSLDKGSSWKTIFGTIEGIVSAIAIDPTTGYLYVHGTNLRDGGDFWRFHTGMYKSTNKGQSWQSIDNGFPFVFDGLADYSYAIAALAVDALHPNTIYAGTRLGVYRSQNAGKNWLPFNDGLTNLNIHSIAVNPVDSSVYAGTDHGLFKIEFSKETCADIQGKMPAIWNRIKRGCLNN
jgi:photosystem II stability/assembly factor-like uncharacterized protein